MITKVEGVDYSNAGIDDIRRQLIHLRNGAMDQGEWNWVIIVTHAIAQLAYLIELEGGTVEKHEDDPDFTEFEFIGKLYTRLIQDREASGEPTTAPDSNGGSQTES